MLLDTMDIIDLHCDTITECYKNNIDLINKILNVSLDKLDKKSKWAQFFAVYIPDEINTSKALDYFIKNCEYFLNQLEKYKDLVLQADKNNTIDTIFKDKKIAAVLAVENAKMLAGNIDNIDYLKKYGVKLVALTWNGKNEIASGNDTECGLSLFGRQVITELEKQKIVVDVSHLNDNSFFDVATHSTKPFIASHSNSRKIHNNKRNLTDEQITHINSIKGLIGLNFYTNFISDKDNIEVSDLFKHIYHFLELGCENTLAIGSDYDGATIPPFINSTEKIAILYNYMIQCGIKENIIKKIMFENAYYFFKHEIDL